MKRVQYAALAVCAVLLAVGPARAGGDKVHTVGKGLKIEGEVNENDGKVRVQVGNMTGELLGKQYQVKMSAGKKYVITMDNAGDDPKFDPFITVRDKADKQLGFDDDSGGQLNSRLVFLCPKDDTYKIAALSLNGASGKFVLKVSESADKVLEVGKGLKLKGKLAGNARNVTYSVKMEEGATYEIRLSSKAFDSYLFVKDGAGKQLDYDDDSGGGFDSKLEFRAPAAGVYVIIATSLGMQGTGDYELTVTKKE
jgi:hypothetical protein